MSALNAQAVNGQWKLPLEVIYSLGSKNAEKLSKILGLLTDDKYAKLFGALLEPG